METCGTHIPSTEIDPLSLLPPEGFSYVFTPYMTTGPIKPPTYSTPLVPQGYNSHDDAFLDHSGIAFPFHNLIWSSGVMHTTSSFVPNMSVTAQNPTQPTMSISETHVRLNISSPPIVATVTAVPNVSEQPISSYVPMSGMKLHPPYTPRAFSGNYPTPPPILGACQPIHVVSNPGGTSIPSVTGNVITTPLHGHQVPLTQHSYQQPYNPIGTQHIQTPYQQAGPLS